MDRESAIDIEIVDNNFSDTTGTCDSYRVPVNQKGNISIVMKGKSHRVIDIRPGGVCILTKDEIDVDPVQFITAADLLVEDCELVCPEITVKNLTARIVHSSLLHDKGCGNGMHFVTLSGDDKMKIEFQISETERGSRK